MPAAAFWYRVPYQMTFPDEYVSVCLHGRVGRLPLSVQKTYLSSALFVGRLRIDIELFTPASAREYAAFCLSLTPALREFALE